MRQRVSGGSTAYIYAVLRGTAESAPYATRRGRFLGYRRAEDFAPGELDPTRPPSTLNRREPEWAGYLMIDDLRELEAGHWIALTRFRVRGKPFSGTVVRHPVLVEAPSGEDLR